MNLENYYKIKDIDCKVSDGYGYEYSAFISLTNLDLMKLKKSLIKKFRLYIYDEDIDLTKSKNFTFFVNEISKMN